MPSVAIGAVAATECGSRGPASDEGSRGRGQQGGGGGRARGTAAQRTVAAQGVAVAGLICCCPACAHHPATLAVCCCSQGRCVVQRRVAGRPVDWLAPLLLQPWALASSHGAADPVSALRPWRVLPPRVLLWPCSFCLPARTHGCMRACAQLDCDAFWQQSVLGFSHVVTLILMRPRWLLFMQAPAAAAFMARLVVHEALRQPGAPAP